MCRLCGTRQGAAWTPASPPGLLLVTRQPQPEPAESRDPNFRNGEVWSVPTGRANPFTYFPESVSPSVTVSSSALLPRVGTTLASWRATHLALQHELLPALDPDQDAGLLLDLRFLHGQDLVHGQEALLSIKPQSYFKLFCKLSAYTAKQFRKPFFFLRGLSRSQGRGRIGAPVTTCPRKPQRKPRVPERTAPRAWSRRAMSTERRTDASRVSHAVRQSHCA